MPPVIPNLTLNTMTPSTATSGSNSAFQNKIVVNKGLNWIIVLGALTAFLIYKKIK